MESSCCSRQAENDRWMMGFGVILMGAEVAIFWLRKNFVRSMLFLYRWVN